MAVFKHAKHALFTIALSLAATAALSSVARADGSAGLAPFTTDGCTDFPDGDLFNPTRWRHCCIEHDLAYWAGGTYDDRWNADVALKNCVAATGQWEVAELMFNGVRVGGSPFLPTPFRWGYGWPVLLGYRALEANEVEQVRSLTPADPLQVTVTGSCWD